MGDNWGEAFLQNPLSKTAILLIILVQNWFGRRTVPAGLFVAEKLAGVSKPVFIM